MVGSQVTYRPAVAKRLGKIAARENEVYHVRAVVFLHVPDALHLGPGDIPVGHLFDGVDQWG